MDTSVLDLLILCQKACIAKNPKVAKTKDGTITLLSKCEEWDSKKSRFI